MFQSVPTALGRTSLKHKVHALGHALRLTSQSWQNVGKLLRSTLTVTGDLGTESRFPYFAASLRSLFGEWYANEVSQPEDDGFEDFNFVTPFQLAP